MSSFEQNRAPRSGQRAKSRTKSAEAAPRRQVLLGWVALVVILASALQNGAFQPPLWTLLCLVTLFLFAVQVAFDILDGLRLPARRALWVALPFVAVMLWLLVQSRPHLFPGLAHPFWTSSPDGGLGTISAHPDAGSQAVMRYLCYGMLFWIFLRSAGTSTAGARAYIRAIALFSTGLALYAFVSLSTGYNLLLDVEQTEKGLLASFLNRNTYATVAIFGVLANMTAYSQAISTGQTHQGLVALRDFLEAFFSSAWVFALGALIGLAALAMTYSRGGAAAGVVGVATLVWALRRRDGNMKLGTYLVPLVIFAFVAAFMTSGLLERIALLETEQRPIIFRHALVGILDRPFLGHGAGAYPEVSPFYIPPELASSDTRWVHNSYLENAFEFGVPAAIVFFFTLGLIGWRLRKGVLVRRRDQEIPAFAFACFTAAAVHATVDFSLQFPAVAALFAAILGIGWGQSFSNRRSRSSIANSRGQVHGQQGAVSENPGRLRRHPNGRR